MVYLGTSKDKAYGGTKISSLENLNVYSLLFTNTKNICLQILSDIQKAVHRDIFLQCKPTGCIISQIYLIKYSTCYGHVHCPSSGISQHCIHVIGICHSSAVGCLLAWSGWNILTTLADSQQN